MAPRNARWSREELILALDLYLRYGPERLRRRSPHVQALSYVLNCLPGARNRRVDARYRSPSAVALKIQMFRRLDPRRAAGLTHGSKGEAAVWRDYSDNTAALHKEAEAIRRTANPDVDQRELPGV